MSYLFFISLSLVLWFFFCEIYFLSDVHDHSAQYFIPLRSELLADNKSEVFELYIFIFLLRYYSASSVVLSV